MKELSLYEVKALWHDQCLFIDTRDSGLFCEGYIPGAVSVPLGETFEKEILRLSEIESQIILLVSDETAAQQITAADSLATDDSILGLFIDGFKLWKAAGLETDMLITIEADEFAMDYQYDDFVLIDLRPEDLYAREHIRDAENIPWNQLLAFLPELNEEESFYIYGNNGDEAVMAASWFRREGFERVRPVSATYEEIKSKGFPLYQAGKKESPKS